MAVIRYFLSSQTFGVASDQEQLHHWNTRTPSGFSPADKPISNECRENPQLTYFVDITTEAEPYGVGSFQVEDGSGDGVNFCARGGRFGAHSSDENII